MVSSRTIRWRRKGEPSRGATQRCSAGGQWRAVFEGKGGLLLERLLSYCERREGAMVQAAQKSPNQKAPQWPSSSAASVWAEEGGQRGERGYTERVKRREAKSGKP